MAPAPSPGLLVRTALSHRQPERVPVDFGSSPTSGMHCSIVSEIRDWFGLEKKTVRVHEPYQMLGWLDEDLKEVLGIDTEAVFPRGTLFGFQNKDWKEWRAPWGQDLLVPSGFNTRLEDSGDTLIFPEGDLMAKPSGRLPSGGYFFDAIVRQDHFDENRPDPRDNAEEFTPLEAEELEYLEEAVKRAAGSGRAVVLTLPGTAFGDIALVPAPWMKDPRGIRDITEWYVSTSSRRDYIHEVFERQCGIAIWNLARVREAVGDLVDVAFVCGTDFGTQTSTFCSELSFRELWLPYYKRVNGWIHAHTNWKTFKHSCGAVESFIPSFIEAGFDILNPVQCSATGMDPQGLKKKYGDQITFWGGGVDTQKTLPFGSEAQVREEVLRRCEIFSKGGGFVFNSVHNVQAQTPVANVLAMFRAVKEFNGLG